MPDSANDLIALTAQMNALRGDLNRRFEQSSGRFEQLGGSVKQLDAHFEELNRRMNALTVTRKVSLPFSATLDGTWVGGTTSPQATLPGPGAFPVARGKMLVDLPNLSRIAVFRASVSFLGIDLGDLDLSFICTTSISLQRVGLNAASEPVVQLSGFRSNNLDLQGVPIAGREFVDNDLFEYSIAAELVVPNAGLLLIPEAMFVVKTFQVDCIVA